MKKTITMAFGAALLFSVGAMAQTSMRSRAPEGFKYMPSKEVEALTSQPGPGAKTAFPVDHENYFLEYAERNDKGNEAEVHAHWTHYIHVLSGEATQMTPEAMPAEWLQPPTDRFTLGPGDVVEAEILGVRNTKSVSPILPDGTFFFDLLPAVRVAGMSLEELRAKLETDLTAYYRSPQVAVILRIVRSKRVWMMGRVSNPGIYPLDTPMTIVEAIARSGGLMSSRFSGTTEELADLRHSFILRDGKLLPVDFHRLLSEGDGSQNIYLRDRDYVCLPSALSKEVYVFGSVLQPRSVGFRDRVTLVSAIAAARDVIPGAFTERVLIIRGSLTKPEVFTANYQAMLIGSAPDVELQPRDIIWVADQPWGDLQKYVKSVITTFVRTVAANEGAHYAIPRADKLQINLQVAPK